MNTTEISSITELRDNIKERVKFERFLKTFCLIFAIPGTFIMFVSFLIALSDDIYLALVYLLISIVLMVLAFCTQGFPDKPASRIAQKFFAEKYTFAFESLAKDLGIKLSPEDFKSIHDFKKDYSFANFSLGKLIFSFSWTKNKNYVTFKQEDGKEIVVKKWELLEDFTADNVSSEMFIITYRQCQTKESKGKEYQQMKYYVPV